MQNFTSIFIIIKYFLDIFNQNIFVHVRAHYFSPTKRLQPAEPTFTGRFSFHYLNIEVIPSAVFLE